MSFFNKIGIKLKDSYNELVNKVTWPTRSELSNSAIVVMIASIIIALFVFVVDFAFSEVMNLVYRVVI
ncbi:preprotein translocase subunit SecE [Porphyromonas macacae]|uniref:preprotein translocase subunit SecE n=1 Tax=Porphyromonas macacae TaxID=28115 RepID=UPI0003A24728|nr:preprotein translocase subunit SecE [Porphyromonas macacae]